MMIAKPLEGREDMQDETRLRTAFILKDSQNDINYIQFYNCKFHNRSNEQMKGDSSQAR